MNTSSADQTPLFQTCTTCGVLQPITAFQWGKKGYIAKRCHTCAFPPPPTELTEHTCVRCGQTKPISEFSRNHGRYPKSWCRACNRAYMEAWHAAHPRAPKPPKPQPTEKRCNECGIIKPIDQFSYLTGYGRYIPYCHDCQRIRSNRYYWSHRLEWLAQDAHRRERNREKIAERRRARRDAYRDCDARRRARKRNAPRVEKIDRIAIMVRDDCVCYICHKVCDPESNLTLDHVIPLARGGAHTVDNLRVCCRSCNSHKRHRLPSEFDPRDWLPPSVR